MRVISVGSGPRHRKAWAALPESGQAWAAIPFATLKSVCVFAAAIYHQALDLPMLSTDLSDHLVRKGVPFR